tara:strand:+ start:440 stop:1081 length:642 start_codon:yes stop_codon:yes gene_type:complete
MTARSKSTLKGYFNTGDTPTEENYGDLIDSKLNIIDATAQTISSKLIFSGQVTGSSGFRSNANVRVLGDLNQTNGTASFTNATITDRITATGPQKLYANAQTASIATDSTINATDHHLRYVLVTDDTTITLPAVGIGLSFSIVNDNADGTAITVAPNASDKFLYNMQGAAGTDGKYIINTAGTAKKGDYVRLLGISADGWAITEKSGVWTDES